MRRFSIALLLGATACGGQIVDHDRCDAHPDVDDTICARPVFASSALEASTRSLRLVVRETNGEGTDCDDPFDTTSTGLAESQTVAAYPVFGNRYPGLPVALSKYKRLALRLYAHDEDAYPSVRGFGLTRPPIAAGCVVADIPSEAVGTGASTPYLRVDVPLEARP